MEIIKIENLTFSYPELEKKALCDINLSINSGEFVTVCGKSGCGKSTLLKQLKPILSPYGNKTGRIMFSGKDIETLSHCEQTEKIGFVMQNPDNQIVTDKVWHELAFGLESLSCPTDEIRARVAEMTSFFGIQAWFHKNTSDLSGGQKQLLNLASVMVMQPSVLILDEPTSQLDPIAAQNFLEMLAKINREIGTTIILSEHRLEEAVPLSDRIVVMENGSIIADGTAQEVGQHLYNKNSDMVCALPTPMRVYFGVQNGTDCPVTIREGRVWIEGFKGKVNPQTEKSELVKNDNETAVLMKDVWFRYEKSLPDVVKGLSINVKQGELYAIVGGNGVGKSTALSLIMSIMKAYRGKIKVSGKLAMLPQNPQLLFTQKTLQLDLEEMTDDNSQAQIAEVAKICELDGLLDKHPYDLSGGEAQRAALAKVLLTKPDILLLDEPTKGLDAPFKNKIAHILSELQKQGLTVIMVSHDIEFCARYVDRCGMFFDGNIVGEGIPREFFMGKSFYTTAANRMARDIIPDAVLAEDIVNAINKGGI